MKVIQSFLLLAVGLCATALLHAQQVKAEVTEPAGAKTPAAATKIKLQPAAAIVAETPPPLKKDDAGKNKLNPQPAAPVTDVHPVITQTQMQPAYLRQQNN